jgi:hypothetical protein
VKEGTLAFDSGHRVACYNMQSLRQHFHAVLMHVLTSLVQPLSCGRSRYVAVLQFSLGVTATPLPLYLGLSVAIVINFSSLNDVRKLSEVRTMPLLLYSKRNNYLTFQLYIFL